MAETTYDRTKPQKRFTAAVSRGLRESAVIAIGVIALIMLVALASYHRDDPAFSSTGGADLGVRNRANSAVRIGGFTLMLFASCGLATLHWSPGVLRETAGGVVGQFIGNGLAANLNFLGATLFMLSAWMAGVSLAFGVSWLRIIDKIGAGIWSGIAWMKARRSTARDIAVGVEAKKARVEAAKVEEKKAASRPKPRIE